MNDLFLTIVVIGAVIVFGVLISAGNERQRQAIDALHQAYKQWAIQDLRFKRGTASAQIQIPDLTAWLTKVTTIAFGYNTHVVNYQIYNEPITAIEFHDGVNTVLCTLESPAKLRRLLRKRRSALRVKLSTNSLALISKKTSTVELSMLNAGTTFDIELPVAWKTLTTEITGSETLWAYILHSTS